MPGGPVGPASRWAATSNVEVGQTTYPVNGGRAEREGRKGSEGQSHKEEERKGGSEAGKGGQAPLAKGGTAVLGYQYRVPRILRYASADGAGQPN